MREFVGEQYLSGSDTAAVKRGTDAARHAAEQLGCEGVAVEFVRSIFVPEDETCLYIYQADSIETVQLAIARADLRLEHVAEAISDSGTKRGLT
jgi:hypothetical protein